MTKRSPLFLNALAAIALAGCSTGALTARASDTPVDVVAQAISEVAATTTGAPRGPGCCGRRTW